MTATRRLAAILHADVHGYSRLMGSDEERTVRVLKASRELMAREIERHRGRVVNAPGDSVLAEFASIVDAVTCAVAVQDGLAERNRALPAPEHMSFRIGINLGDVIADEGAIYGDGVNVAARLESLADAGGIVVSGSAHDQVVDKLKLGFEDLGEKAVKNIARAVRAYRVLRGQAAPTPARAAREDKPAIAVLPFQNMSGEAEQEYFSDGITEDIITDLSKLSGLLVIARNTTFTYKGKPVDVRRLKGELGVSHVLEGSVRRAGNRVRITAQLLDAGSGHHVWAERYDRDLQDIFAVQDEITREIVAALDVRLLRGEQASLWRQLLRRPEALDAYYRGLDLLNRITREANAQAAQRFGEVLRLEPQSPLGHLGMAWVHLSDFRYGWSASASDSMAQAVALAQKALELDPDCADAHALLGYYHLVSGNHDEAIASGERSVALAPNHADNAANLACSYVVSGKPAEGVAAIQRAMRLSPVYPAWYLNILGFGQYQLGQYEESEQSLRLCLERDPTSLDCHLVIAAGHHAAGRPDAARREAEAVMRKDPAFRIAGYEARLGIVRDRKLVERFFALMRELGLQ